MNNRLHNLGLHNLKHQLLKVPDELFVSPEIITFYIIKRKHDRQVRELWSSELSS